MNASVKYHDQHRYKYTFDHGSKQRNGDKDRGKITRDPIITTSYVFDTVTITVTVTVTIT